MIALFFPGIVRVGLEVSAIQLRPRDLVQVLQIGVVLRHRWVGVLVGEHKSTLSFVFGFLAVVAATSNVVGGFLITDRMLKMFKSSRPTKP